MSETRFTTVAEAKDFLVDKVVAEAQIGGVAMSQAERKMMYYSVLEKTIADEVADQFPDYDPDYEAKISGLIRSAYKRNEADRVEIKAAIKKLKSGDHYLVIMADEALNPPGPSVNSKKRQALMVAGLVGLMTLVTYWQSWKEAFWHWWAK